jgi:hypothetical protein
MRIEMRERHSLLQPLPGRKFDGGGGASRSAWGGSSALLVAMAVLTGSMAASESTDMPHRATAHSYEKSPAPSWAFSSTYMREWPLGAYTTMTRPSPHYRIYHNLWYQNGRWFAVTRPDDPATDQIEDGVSANMILSKLPIADLHAFTKDLHVRSMGRSHACDSSPGCRMMG